MYLDEINSTSTGFQIYLDMDGVIVNWSASAMKLIGADSWMGYDRKQDSEFWRTLHSMDLDEVEDYWANMKWLSEGKILWRYLEKFRPIILSKPDNRPGFREACERGKARWIKQHLGSSVKYIFSTEKWRYAKPNAILIDDTAKNNVPFEDHGGSAILHDGNAKRTITMLQERFKFPKR